MGNSASSDRKKEAKAQLVEAIKDGNLTAVKDILAENHSLIKSKLDSGRNAIHMAVMFNSGNLGVLTHMLSFTSINPKLGKAEASILADTMKALDQSRAKDGMSPLMLACEIGDEQAMRLLLEAGANFWFRDRIFNRTCMHFVAAKGHAALVGPLVRFSEAWDPETSHFARTSVWPLVSIPTWAGATPLMYAAWCNQPETLTALLQHGAPPGSRVPGLGYPLRDPYCMNMAPGSTALHAAADNCSRGAATALLINHMRAQNDYLQLLADDRLAQGRGEPPPAEPRRRPRDPRLLLDGEHRIPFSLARSTGCAQLINLLNPFTSLTAALGTADRPIGVATLKQIAAKAAQAVLLAQVDSLARAITQTKDRVQRVSESGRAPCKRRNSSRRQASSTLSPSLSTPSNAARQNPSRLGRLSSGSAVGPAAAGGQPAHLDGASRGSKNMGKSGLCHPLTLRQGADSGVLAPCSEGDELCLRERAEADADAAMASLLGSPRLTSEDAAAEMDTLFIPRPSLRSVGSWRLASRMSGPGAAPQSAGVADWAMDTYPSLSGALSPQRSVARTPEGAPGGGTAAGWNGDADAAGTSPGDAGVSPSGLGRHNSQAATPQCAIRRLSCHRKEQRLLDRQSQMEARLSGHQIRLQQLADGMMSTPGPEGPGPTPSLLRTGSVDLPAPPMKRFMSAFQVQHQLSGGMGASLPPMLDQQILNSFASLADEVEDGSLEHTLVAARYHRLYHGVSSQVSMGLRPNWALHSSELPQYLEASAGCDNPDAGNESLPASAAAPDPLVLHPATPPSPAPGPVQSSGHDFASRAMSMPLPPPALTTALAVSEPAASVDPGPTASPFAPAPASPFATASCMSSMASHAASQLSRGPSAALPAEEDEYDRTCGVCLDEGDFIVTRPCEHKICVDCARELLKLHSIDPVPCPFCRSLLTGFGGYKE